MSFEDFCTYFLIAGISHLREILNIFKHYNKDEASNGPLVSLLNNKNNNNHCYILIHQKNPRIILKKKNIDN